MSYRGPGIREHHRKLGLLARQASTVGRQKQASHGALTGRVVQRGLKLTPLLLMTQGTEKRTSGPRLDSHKRREPLNISAHPQSTEVTMQEGHIEAAQGHTGRRQQQQISEPNQLKSLPSWCFCSPE